MKILKPFLCILAISLMLSGCMNSTHLKDLMVVEGMGVDVSGDNVKVSVKTLNTSKMGASSELPEGNATVVNTQEGNTIADALSGFEKKLSKELFYGQVKIIVFGNELAEKGFGDKLDYFMRSADSRADVAVCLSEETAGDILKSNENDSRVPCENVLSLLKNGEQSGVSAYVTTIELLNRYKDKTSDIFLPVLKLEEKEDNVSCVGVGIFNNNKLVHMLKDEEVKGFLLANGRVKGCFIEFKDDKLGNVGAELSAIRVKRYVEIKNGGVYYCNRLQCDIIINEIERGIITSLDKNDMERICSLAERKLEKICKDSFTTCRKYNSDCFRVGEYLAMSSPESYKKLSDDWNSYFPDVKSDFTASCKLKKISERQ